MAVTLRRLVDTPSGPARLHIDGDGPVRLVLGHGAGGGVEAPDLLVVRDVAVGLGLQVVRVEQPWRVRGRRVAEAPPRLDAAWLAALSALPALPVVVGGRSSGARVACRTAGRVAAAGPVLGVLCLAFPLLPPPRGARTPVADRSAELALPQTPVLVVQGERDAFGVPPASAGVEVAVIAGADHGFAVRRAAGTADVRAQGRVQIAGAVREWLAGRLAGQTLT